MWGDVLGGEPPSQSHGGAVHMLFLACRFPTPAFIPTCHIHMQKIGCPGILRTCLFPLHHQEMKRVCWIVPDLDFFFCVCVLSFNSFCDLGLNFPPSLSWADKIGLKFVVKIDLALHVCKHQSDAWHINKCTVYWSLLVLLVRANLLNWLLCVF